MKKLIATSLLAIALAAPAYAQSVSEKTGVNSVLGVAPSTADFVAQAAMTDMFEIQSSQMAATKTTGATKSFAEQMISDHQKTSTELKGLISSGKVQATPPTALDDSHQKMIAKLQSLTGDAFAKQYHSDQESGHKDAVSLFERYSKSGDNADLKAWAGKTLPAIQHHYQMAQQLNKQS
jgi:putative membrane protein